MNMKYYHKRKMFIFVIAMISISLLLMIRLIDLMIFHSEYYQEQADVLHERERSIKAKRGKIYDKNGIILADNEAVCTISVIHNQIEEAEKVIAILSKELAIDSDIIRKKVEKYSSIERIRSNVPKEIGDKIRLYELEGVMVDEDYKRFYPYGDLLSKVIGFTGGDNQGIIGLEVMYDSYLKGNPGMILTVTDARGVEVKNIPEDKKEPVEGYHLITSLDYHIQCFVQQTAEKILKQRQAKGVSIILMNPQNGEIIAMTDVPEFNLNEPFKLTQEAKESSKMEAEQWNYMWRNGCINDTYEPGSTFKIVTACAALETGKVSLEDTFYCPGYRIVDDRRIRCHKVIGHGSETFEEGLMNSCNPVFIDIGLKNGVDCMYTYFDKLGLMNKTGIDLPGEASSIMHRKENVGEVELATISFGQSFQITPLQLLRSASAIINGGHLVTPHLGVALTNDSGYKEIIHHEIQNQVIEANISEKLKVLLEKVVAEGTGNKCYIEEYRIGGKTATSQKLPRSSAKYIASFIGFVPADQPSLIGIICIDEPQGLYYGGTIAAPVMKEIFENILPYYLEGDELLKEGKLYHDN